MDDVDERPTAKRTGAPWRGQAQDVRGPDVAGRLTRLRWPRDLVLPAVLAAVQVGATYGAEHHHRLQLHPGAASWALLLVGPLALVFRRRYPVAVMWITFAATLGPSGSRFAYLSLVVSFFVAATTGHRHAAWVVIVVGYVGSLWLAPLVWGQPVATLDGALLLGAWLAVLVIAAEVVRMRRERMVEGRLARQADRERQASEARLGMARDLHDVMGHHISLINVQAGVGLDLMDTDPDQAKAALSAIKSVSKEALDELRTLLAAVRQDGEKAPLSPAPGLSRLTELIELTRAAGFEVSTEQVGEPLTLPAAIDLAAYRIVQESLTNVTRHAGPTTAIVRIRYGPDDLVIEVLDQGRATVPVGSSRARAGARVAGAGSGIAGMRQRAAALGGTLDAGPRPGRGFAVTARLPVRGPR
ncbi:MAG TPA: sensor histidine kinase [Acidimicrobiales bacterium]|nr:sensor histidine kinase [Acidimicrobiales bacterium]